MSDTSFISVVCVKQLFITTPNFFIVDIAKTGVLL